MPQEFVYFGNTWLAHHPGWTMYTWTDRHVSGLTQPATLEQSTAKSGKSNVLRYEILVRYGGVYIDTDFECLRNIEPILNNVACFVGMQCPDVANNAIIGAVPGHAFIRDLVVHIPARARVMSGGLSIRQSGPYYLTERLRGRRDVTVFPASVFYPYQWHERWRRHEHFPSAYGVHHWSLSWRKRPLSKPCSKTPSVSVVVINAAIDVRRLRWALEGLCEQTAPATFEALLLDRTGHDGIRRLAASYSDRIRIHYVAEGHLQQGLVSHDLRHYIKGCLGKRVILLDSRCVADPELVEWHARLGGEAVAGFSSSRFYPAGKFFDFKPPLDYDSLRMHSVADPRYSKLNGPALDHWHNVRVCCISVPRNTLVSIGLPTGLDCRSGAAWFARELSLRGYSVLALPPKAQVTQLM
jgi:hypothetical protein